VRLTFPYHRGLIRHSHDARRYETPPSYVGLRSGVHVAPLSRRLEQTGQFGAARQLTTNGSVRIDLSRDGTRPVIVGRRIWHSSLVPSLKNGAAIPCESSNELLFAFQCEVDPGVISYAAQAAEFTFRLNDSVVVYHADFLRNLPDGTIEVIEVKPNRNYLENPAYAAKLEAVADLCRRAGWKFRVIFGEDLRRPSFFNFHVAQICSHRFYRIQSSVQDAILNRMSSASEPVAYDEISSLCANHVEARAVVSALICRSILYVDLSKRIVASSPVALVERRAA